MLNGIFQGGRRTPFGRQCNGSLDGHIKWQQLPFASLLSRAQIPACLRILPNGSQAKRLLCAIMKLKNQLLLCHGKGREGKVHYAISRAMPAVQTQSTRHNTTYSIQGGQIWKIEIRWRKNCPICAPATPRQLVAYEFELQHLA